MSHHPIPCHVMSSYIMFYRVMSYHVLSCYVISYHNVSCHLTSSLVMSFFNVSCYVISCHVLSCRIISCTSISSHLISCYTVSRRVMDSLHSRMLMNKTPSSNNGNGALLNTSISCNTNTNTSSSSSGSGKGLNRMDGDSPPLDGKSKNLTCFPVLSEDDRNYFLPLLSFLISPCLISIIIYVVLQSDDTINATWMTLQLFPSLSIIPFTSYCQPCLP